MLDIKSFIGGDKARNARRASYGEIVVQLAHALEDVPLQRAESQVSANAEAQKGGDSRLARRLIFAGTRLRLSILSSTSCRTILSDWRRANRFAHAICTVVRMRLAFAMRMKRAQSAVYHCLFGGIRGGTKAWLRCAQRLKIPKFQKMIFLGIAAANAFP